MSKPRSKLLTCIETVVLTTVATPEIIWGCVVVVSSCEEGAGGVRSRPSVSGSWSCGAGWSTGAAARRSASAAPRVTIGARLQDLPPRPGRRVRSGVGAVGGAPDQPAVPLAGRADRDRGPAPGLLPHPPDRAGAGPDTIDDLAGTAPQRHRRSVSPVPGAHRRATARRARRHRRRIETTQALHQLLGELLDQRWSPQQISRHLRRRHPGEPAMWLCHESIYQAVYQPGSTLLHPSKLAPHRRTDR